MLYHPTGYTEKEQELDLAELKLLTDTVKGKYGYDFSNYAQSSFKRRVMMVLKKNALKSIPQLIERIGNDQPFFEQFLLDVTVNTTEMFRDPSYFKALRSQVLPVISSRPEFNIWHAACSTGEEVISTAILLREEAILHRSRSYATDINHLVLKRAADGKFPYRNLDLFSANYAQTGPKATLEHYYRRVDSDLVFDPTLLANVRFKHHDLATDEHFFKFDLIMCRNVMIYFNQQLQNRVFELLHNSLFLGGFLALGAKESLIWCRIADKFEVVNETEKIYRKVKL